MCFAQIIGQDVCVSCTYAVLLGAKSTQNRRGNAMGSGACFPGPLCAMSAGNKATRQASPAGGGGSRSVTERANKADTPYPLCAAHLPFPLASPSGRGGARSVTERVIPAATPCTSVCSTPSVLPAPLTSRSKWARSAARAWSCGTDNR